MVKLFGFVVLFGLTFSLGYYVGQRPVGELRRTITDLSRNVLDTTLGIERNLRVRQGLVDAKSRLIQAKSDVLDRNYGSATKALSGTIESLEAAANASTDAQKGRLKTLVERLREIQVSLSSGKPPTRARLDEIQAELDGLM
ncbi:MAG TPA: hypothetical protein VGQ60_02980 [Nitrospiraceae bacterium]|jgi:molecular chaperone GrpE (heat shock protein)|nr:hypothetical protein [Nitrospiraceae bacterium]